METGTEQSVGLEPAGRRTHARFTQARLGGQVCSTRSQELFRVSGIMGDFKFSSFFAYV